MPDRLFLRFTFGGTGPYFGFAESTSPTMDLIVLFNLSILGKAEFFLDTFENGSFTVSSGDVLA